MLLLFLEVAFWIITTLLMVMLLMEINNQLYKCQKRKVHEKNFFIMLNF